jgi:hypothetical protein
VVDAIAGTATDGPNPGPPSRKLYRGRPTVPVSGPDGTGTDNAVLGAA